MVLKNKDGSTYQLTKPNPIMKEQSLWKGEKFILHNMNFISEKTVDEREIKPFESDIEVKDDFISELEETKKPEEQEPVFERVTITAPDTKRIEEEKKPEIEKIFIHCLPATIKTKHDELYGDVYQTIQYGKPTSFEAVLLKESDTYFEVWTDTDIADIGAVLFPKTNTKRWWKVKRRVRKSEGWILNCIMSEYQPSFDS